MTMMTLLSTASLALLLGGAIAEQMLKQKRR